MNKTLYLFRHGLATKSTQGYGEHIKTARLLPEAYKPIEKMAEFLQNIPADHFFSSEYIRCVQTSEIITKITHIPFVTDKRLNEYNDISLSNFVNNLSSFLRDIETMNGNSLFICTHAADLVVLKKLLFNVPIDEADTQSNAPLPGVLEIIKNGITEEINFNE
ncbi:MAG TPA: phosphoglycerate mutase family protein [Candidatus Saccharimonadales bacterium]|nr:phosphoglycerate mutase family protein [Candidatus Saccharimonadales bacterium]